MQALSIPSWNARAALRVSRIDSDGLFVFSDRPAAAPEFAAPAELVLSFRDREVRCRGVPVRRWTHDDQVHRIPAVVHQVWRAPDGSLAFAAANWTADPITLRVVDDRLAAATEATVATGAGTTSVALGPTGTLTLPPHSCALLR